MHDSKWSSDIETDMKWSIKILDMDTSFSMRMRGVLPLCLSTMSMVIRIKRMGGEIMDDNFYRNDFDKDRIQNCINHIKTAIDVDPWAKVLCEQIMSRAIPKKPYGKHTNYRCSVCNTRVRSGQGSSSRIRDTVCRKCFTVIDWSDANDSE